MPDDESVTPEGVVFTYGGKTYRRVKPPPWTFTYRVCRYCLCNDPWGRWVSQSNYEEIRKRDREKRLCSALRNRELPNGSISVSIPSCRGGRYYYEEVETDVGTA